MNNELVPIGIVLSSALSYWIASGASRADYKAFHVALGLLLFSVLWLFVYGAVEQIFGNLITIRVLISSVVVLFVAGLWRTYIAEWVFQYLRNLRITTASFGPSRAWDVFESTPDGREFHYIRVHLVNGVQLGSDQACLAGRRKNNEIDFSPGMITDEQGNIVLVVTEIWDKNADDPERNNPVDQHGRTEFTYIPASNITRIQAYIKRK